MEEIYNWMNFFAAFEGDIERDFEKIVSDARIVVLNNEGSEEVCAIVFQDVYPISMSSLSYAFNDSGPTTIKFNAQFDYSVYKMDFSKTSICQINQ